MSASFVGNVGSAVMSDTSMVVGSEVVVLTGAGSGSGSGPRVPILLPFMMKHADDPRYGWAVNNVVKSPPFYDDQRSSFAECGVCCGIPRLPVQLLTGKKENDCVHVMCSSCARKLLSVAEAKPDLDGERVTKGATCPRCRVEFHAKHIKDYEVWFPQQKMMWELFRIRCGGKGCEFVGSPKELLKHEFDCPLRLFLCPCAGCNLEGTKTELMEHVASCKMLRVYCKTCFVSYYPNGVGEYAEHNCLEDLKRVCIQMKSTLMQNDIMWPVRGTCGFEPVCAGDADFETQQGTAAMLSRKTLKRLNATILEDAYAVVTSSPGGTRRLRLDESSVTEPFDVRDAFDTTDADLPSP